MASLPFDSTTSHGRFLPEPKRQRRTASSAAPAVSVPPAVSRDDEGNSPERNVENEQVPESQKNPWDVAVEAELELYAKSGPDNANNYAVGYQPAPMSKQQLLKATNEFVKRCREAGEDSESNPYVLVSRNCEDMPNREFELDAIQSTSISKLWYALTKNKDLLIIKYSSDDAHAGGVSELNRCVGNFGIQFGTEAQPIFSFESDGKKVLLSQARVAPDSVLHRNFPHQEPPVDLRAPFIAELEYENRGPKALMEQLSTYLLQPVADYVLGIKIYKRSGPPAMANEKRPFAALALLWRRGAGGPLPPGGRAMLVLVRSFGMCELTMQSKNAFCTQRGILQQVEMDQLDHPVNHTHATDTIIVPKAHLVQGAQDENGNPVHALETDQDLVISLGRLRGIFDMRLPP